MRLYKGKLLTTTKKIFNYHLTCARRYVECTFGIFSNKWRIFHRALDVDVNFAVSIVKTCCLLHNFVHQRDSYKYVDTLSVVGLQENHPVIQRNSAEGPGP